MRKRQMILRVMAVITVAIVVYLGINAVEVNRVIQSLEKQIEQAEELLEEEQMLYEELQQEREQMDTLEYIEQVAREKLGMVKPDDIVFKVK